MLAPGPRPAGACAAGPRAQARVGTVQWWPASRLGDVRSPASRCTWLHFCTGCNGSGVAVMTYLGTQVARRILQDGQSDSAYFGLDFPGVPVPLYRGKAWFLPIVGEYYRYMDRKERRTGT